LEQNIKHIIKEEYIKCVNDPVYFFRKYCYIQHPQRGKIHFHLYPFQERVISLLQQNDYSIINKSRQLGISTLVAGLSLHTILFNTDKNILCIATKQDTAKNMVTKVKYMYNNLPSWLREKGKPQEENKLTLRLNNGSQIKATSAASDAGRSEAVSLLLIDEAAFIENIEDIWASAQQTLATGGGAIVLSTPFGTGNWFHRTWVKAEASENNFTPIRLPWFVHPERDQSWRDEQDINLGVQKAAQECDADFVTSGDTVFHSEWLTFIEETTIKEPIERRGADSNLWVWESADYSREYMIIADVARGDGKDFSAAQVIDIETNTQVAEYKGHMPPKEFGYFLVGLSTEYNQGLLVVENANIGWSTLDAILERGYRNLYYSPKSDIFEIESYFARYENNNNLVPGFTTSLKTRPLIINKFSEYVGDRSVVIQSRRLLEEMKVFIWKNGRGQAQSGYNDDLTMSFGIGMYLRDTSLRFKQQGLDMTRASLNGITSTKPNIGVYRPTGVDNPYSIKTPDGEEDITWLLG
jgi:hypothetical protein